MPAVSYLSNGMAMLVHVVRHGCGTTMRVALMVGGLGWSHSAAWVMMQTVPAKSDGSPFHSGVEYRSLLRTQWLVARIVKPIGNARRTMEP